MPRGGEDVGKSAFPYMTGGSICVLWKEIGQDLGEGEIVPTWGSGNSSSKPIPQLEMHRDTFGTVCNRIKIWKQGKCLSIRYITIYSHNGIWDSH